MHQQIIKWVKPTKKDEDTKGEICNRDTMKYRLLKYLTTAESHLGENE